MQSDLGLKERREGVRSCGCTDEATCVSIRDEGAVEHVVAMVFWLWRALCLSLSLFCLLCSGNERSLCLSIYPYKKKMERERKIRGVHLCSVSVCSRAFPLWILDRCYYVLFCKFFIKINNFWVNFTNIPEVLGNSIN